MKFKKSLLAMLALVIIFACLFTLSSCKFFGGDHEHEYTSVTTAATCTADGVITYTCSCGDTYTESISATGHTMAAVAAKAATCTEAGYTAHSACSVCGYTEGKEAVTGAHNYDSKITVYPTTTDAGTRTNTCTACGHIETETINAITFTAPDVAQAIASLIGENQYTLNLDEGSKVITVRELSNYTYDSGEKVFLAFSIAEATISGKNGTLYGHLKLEISRYAVDITDNATDVKSIAYSEDDDETASIYLYINGSDISIELTAPTGEVTEIEEDLNELFLESLLSAYIPSGSEEDLAALAYVFDEITAVALPLLEEALNALAEDVPTVSDDYLSHLESLFALIGENVIESETVGTDTVYTLNLEAFAALLDEIEGKTIAEYLTEVYGEDVLQMLADFIKELPDKTAREIADAVFAFADETGVSVEDLFTAIEVFVYKAGGIEFSIYSFINENANKTLADFLAEASDADAEEIKSSITEAVDEIYATGIEDILSLIVTGDITSADAIIAELKSKLENLESAIAVQLTVDENGALTGADIIFAGFEIEADITADGVSAEIALPSGATITLTSGEDNTTIFVDGGEETLTVTYSASGITMIGYDGEDQILDAEITVTEEGDTTITYGNFEFDGVDYFDLYATSIEGEVVGVAFTIRGFVDEYNGYWDDNDEWVDDVIEVFETLVDFTYINGDTETIYLTIGDVDFVIEFATVEGVETLTIVGSVDGEVEFEALIESASDGLTCEIGDGENTIIAGEIVADSVSGEILEASLVINGYNYYWDEITEEQHSELFEALSFEYASDKLSCEISDGDNTVFTAEILIDPVSGEILEVSLVINGYRHNWDEITEEYYKELYEAVAFEYAAATAENPVYISLTLDGVTLTVEVEETENGILVDIGNGESSIGTISLGCAEGVYTFAIDFEEMVEVSLSVGAGRIEVDIDHLVVGTDEKYASGSYWDGDEHVYQETYLYTIFRYIEAEFGISFTVA